MRPHISKFRDSESPLTITQSRPKKKTSSLMRKFRGTIMLKKKKREAV